MEHIVLPIFQLPCTSVWEIASFVANVKPVFPGWNSGTDIFYLFVCLLLTVIGCFVAFPYVPILLRNLRLARKGTLVFGYYSGSRMVRFLILDGQEVRFRTYSRPRYKIGQKLRVIYNPEKPSEAEIALRSVLWSSPMRQLIWLVFPIILFILLTKSSMPFYVAALLAIVFAGIISMIIDLCLWMLIRLPAAPVQTDDEQDQTSLDENKRI